MENIWPDFPTILDIAWKHFRLNWKYILGVNVVSSLLSSAVGFLIVFLVAVMMYSVKTDILLWVSLIGIISVILFLITSLLSITNILILGESKKISLTRVIRKSVRRLPVFMALSLLIGFFSIGGLAIVVIPGLVIAVLLSYSLYELVLFDLKGTAALKSSMQIVSQNWKQMFVYHLPLFAILIAYSFLTSTIKRFFVFTGVPLIGFSILKFVGSILIGVLAFNLSYVVYMTARERTDRNRPVSLLFPGIVATIGWVVILLFLIPGLFMQKNAPKLPSASPTPFGTITPLQRMEQILERQ